MNCYDCTGDGRTTPAVAICTSCGAALCGDHTRLETQDHTPAATPGNPSHHRTRALICTCWEPIPMMTALEGLDPRSSRRLVVIGGPASSATSVIEYSGSTTMEFPFARPPLGTLRFRVVASGAERIWSRCNKQLRRVAPR